MGDDFVIQCFAKPDYPSSFVAPNEPRLLYACKIDSNYTIHPRILHKHDDFLEILFVRSGTGVYILDETRYPIRAGDLILCNAGTLHDEDPACSNNLSTLCVGVTEVQTHDLPLNHLIDVSYTPVFPAGESAGMIEYLMTDIYNMLADDPDRFAETCHYMMMALVSRVLAAIREYCAVHGDTLRRQPDIIAARVKTYINAHFEEDFSLQDISDALQVSPYYLAHIFKEQTGYSPKQYTLRRRLGEAQTLLITTRRSITDIALGVGFGNLSHFNNMFSKYIGMSPSSYRESYINKEGLSLPVRDLL